MKSKFKHGGKMHLHRDIRLAGYQGHMYDPRTKIISPTHPPPGSHLHTHVSPQNAAVFFNKPAEDQGQELQDLVFLYQEKTNENKLFVSGGPKINLFFLQ